MLIEYPNARKKKLFDSDKELKKEFGQMADKIKERLHQLEAAECLYDLKNLPGKWHDLTQNRKGQVAAHLTGNWRIIIEPADSPLPTLPDGGLDWKGVKKVRVLEVIDYH